MKKKIIISLILAMCCIMASVPTGAVGTSEDCPPCGPFTHDCGGFAEVRSAKHEYEISTDVYETCYAVEHLYYTISHCTKCLQPINGSGERTHSHGVDSHTCGAANNTGCPIN